MSIKRKEVQKLIKGNYIMDAEEPCVIKSTKRIKPGKHGPAKIILECVGLFDKNKRILTIKSGNLVDIPEIIKGLAQINYIEKDLINIMDIKTYEQFNVGWPPDNDLNAKFKVLQKKPSTISSAKVEYWKIFDKIFLSRIFND